MSLVKSILEKDSKVVSKLKAKVLEKLATNEDYSKLNKEIDELYSTKKEKVEEEK